MSSTKHSLAMNFYKNNFAWANEPTARILTGRFEAVNLFSAAEATAAT